MILKEQDIRKKGLFDKYLGLVEKDIKHYFDFKDFIDVNCPACNGTDLRPEFKKSGFKYVSCKRCSTLFINPRPLYKDLEKFYSNSQSMNFWANDFFKPVAEARRKKIFKPRAKYMDKILPKKNDYIIGDIGAGFGLFLEELRKIRPGNHYVAIEPSMEMAGICKNKGLEVECLCLEDIKEPCIKFDLLTAFELTEHLHDPGLFFKSARKILKKDGYLFLTTLNSKGFDIAILWEKSKIITPPHHLNFFNADSIKALLERSGFKILEVSTPGKLDWDIVEGAINSDQADPGRFWKLLAEEGSERSKIELQKWISKNNFSSHMRVVAQKA